MEGYEHQHRWRHRDRSQQHFDMSQDMRDSSKSFGFGLCSRCPPGFGVARRCTLVQDTVCHSCPQGYYAPSYSRKHACWPCSRCGTTRSAILYRASLFSSSSSSSFPLHLFRESQIGGYTQVTGFAFATLDGPFRVLESITNATLAKFTDLLRGPAAPNKSRRMQLYTSLSSHFLCLHHSFELQLRGIYIYLYRCVQVREQQSLIRRSMLGPACNMKRNKGFTPNSSTRHFRSLSCAICSRNALNPLTSTQRTGLRLSLRRVKDC